MEVFAATRFIVTGGFAFANIRRLPTLELLRSPSMRLRVRCPVSARLLFFLALLGCSAAAPPTTVVETLDPRDLYPLSLHNGWSYDVDTGAPPVTLGITRVESVNGDRVEVRTGDTLVHYELSPDGIRVPPDDVWLVRAPLRVGATWPAPGGRTATLVALDARADTAAGEFTDCTEVNERGGKLDLEVRTIYCVGVGPVIVTSTLRSNISERSITVTATLRGYRVQPR